VFFGRSFLLVTPLIGIVAKECIRLQY